jgi:hypothetical protein
MQHQRTGIEMYKPCLVEGCQDSSHHTAKGAKGYCSNHYYRFKKHGNPTQGKTPHGTPKRFLEILVMSSETEECIPWPFSKNNKGYGKLLVDGRLEVASRYLCTLVQGVPDDKRLLALHSCGNGHLACVNPKHVYWGNGSQNTKDAIAHGTFKWGEQSGSSKLSERNVKEIRMLKGIMPQWQIGERFGVTQSNVSAIHRGKSWKHVQG